VGNDSELFPQQNLPDNDNEGVQYSVGGQNRTKHLERDFWKDGWALSPRGKEKNGEQLGLGTPHLPVQIDRRKPNRVWLLVLCRSALSVQILLYRTVLYCQCLRASARCAT